jgi:hypothetical protein
MSFSIENIVHSQFTQKQGIYMTNVLAALFSDGNTPNGVRFVSFEYKAKGTGELARHTVLFGASLKNAYVADAETIESLELSGIHAEAQAAILKSINNSLTKGIGNNDNYTQKDTYNALATGIKVHKETGEIHISGRSIQKKVLEKGVYKETKSRPLTIAKREVEKMANSKRSKIRSYCLSEIKTARIDGDTIVLD